MAIAEREITKSPPGVRSGGVQRVLMTADAVGGVWQYALDLASALKARNIDVTVAVMGPPPRDDQRDEARSRGVRVIEGDYRLEWMENPWADVARAGKWLLDLERQFRPDVVHLNGYAHGALPWRAPAIVAGHSCVRSWWQAVHGVNAPREWDRYSLAVARGLRVAAMVVTPTAAMLDALRLYYGPIARARVIPNGRPPISEASATASAGADQLAKTEIVFAAGRLWDPAKNIDSLCSVAARLPWRVVVAGDCHAPDGSRRLPPNVQYLGRLTSEEIQQMYKRAAIYALPARYEPFGLSILEAAAAGCALVLGDIRSLRENWDGAALFVPSDDRRALARAIESLIGDEASRRDFGCRAMVRARRFTLTAMVDAYLQAYEDVTANHQPSAASVRAAGTTSGVNEPTARPAYMRAEPTR